MGSTVSLILNLLFVVVLVIGFLLGLWRGLKKSALSMAFSVVGVVVAFFFTPMITKSILNININIDGQASTINAYLVNMLKSNPDIATLIENNPSLESFFANLPSAVANTVIFIVLTILVEAVLYIPYRILASVFLKNKPGTKRYRLWGGALGVVKAFVVAIFAFMPISSLAGMLTKVDQREDAFVSENVTEAETNNSKEESLLSQFLPAEAVDVIYAVDNNVFSIVGGACGVDNAMFDFLSVIELGDDKVYVRQEIENYAEAYDIFLQIKEVFDGTSLKPLSQLDFDSIEDTLDKILEGGVYKHVAVESLISVITDYSKYDFMQGEGLVEYYPLLDSVGQSLRQDLQEGLNSAIDYFTNDIKNLFNSFKTLAMDGVLDEVKNLQDKSLNNIIELMSSDKNFTSFSKALNNVFSMNMIRDGITFVSNKLMSSFVEGLDEISVDVKEWTDEKWKELSNDISNVLKEGISLTEKVDISKLLEDPTYIMNDKDVDVVDILTSLGALVDNIRSVELFKNEQGVSIIDSLLEKSNIVLPNQDEIIYDINGETVEITNYKQLMEFIAPVFEKIQDIGLFQKLTESENAKDLILFIADEVEKDSKMLNTLLLPLTQVEPAKTLITTEFVNKVQSDLIDLSNISGYEMWKAELENLTSILTTLNKTNSTGKTYLEYAIDGNVGDILLNLGEDITITELLTPVLKANSTNGIKKSLFQTLDEVFVDITGTENNFGDLENMNFDEIFVKDGGVEDQTNEICAIFENFIAIYKDYNDAVSSSGSYSLENMDKVALGKLVDSIKENAYRKELALENPSIDDKPENEGIFRTVFDNLYNKMLEQFGKMGDIVKDKPRYQISFTTLMETIEQLEDAASSDFVKEVGNIISKGETVTKEDVANLVNTINDSTPEETQQQIEGLLDNLQGLELEIEVPGVSAEEIETVINSNTNINQGIKDKLLAILKGTN